MCGIFGAVELGQGETINTDAVLRSIAHRGPDESGVWRDSGVVLAHTRLKIIDLSPAAAQPMASKDGAAVVVFNGEVYNHHELRGELARAGHQFRSRCDTEVIVEGYLRWGDEVILRLDGMFALGIWDVRRRRLLLARDRAGKKPLFYARLGGSLRFASEAKALLASGIPAHLDVGALPQLLSFGYVPAPRSMLAGIAQLAPASTLVSEAGRPPYIKRYWKAPFAEPPLRCSWRDAKQEVRALVEAAVKRRLEADVPLGAFLSGGIDSTIIVGVMSRLLGRRVKTFSIGFTQDARYDETHYARIAARAFDTDHVEFALQPSSFELVERLVALHDGPFGDSSAIPTSVVSALTREHVTVALTGDGGDELFCGYLRFLAAEAAEWIPPVLRLVAASMTRALSRRRGERDLITRASRFFDSAALPLADRLARLSSLFAFELRSLLRADVRAAIDVDEPLDWMRGVVAASAGASTLSRVLDHNFETYLPYDLLVKADRSSMAHGLETRSPFLDTALVEYVARLPDRFKRRGGRTKWILRRAFADLLPPEILARGKMGFGVPLGTWFRGDLKGYLRDHLAFQSSLYDYVEPGYVGQLLKEHLEERADHGHRLWLLLTLEVWLRALARGTLACAA